MSDNNDINNYEPEPEIKESAYDKTLLLHGMWDIMENML